jgi:CubicO group peptidase (beta-lactamase class C family)
MHDRAVRPILLRAPLIAALFAGPGLAFLASDSPPWPTRKWPRSVPAEQGLDPAPLDRLVATIRKNREIRNIHSLLVVRNGYLVLEEYFDSHDADELHTLQSVSKSFTSTLVGIAIQKGKIVGVDERVLGFFPELEGKIDNLDNRKRRMTLENLLTMRSGTDYTEGGTDTPHSKLNRMSRGWTEFILDRPMISEPGTKFRYDSGAVILTSAILKARYGVHADTFAEEHLFKPLGINRYHWYGNAEGHPHTGGGLDLRSRDMARFGLLYLRGGRWEGKQVVPADWVATSLSRHVTFDRTRGRSAGYGYWWWVLPPDPAGDRAQDIYGAFGFRGQYIFLIPEHDMVVVVTAGGRDWTEERAPRDFLYTHILPAVHP